MLAFVQAWLRFPNPLCQPRRAENSFYTILNASKHSKRRNLSDDTCYHLTNFIALLYRLPGIDLGPFDRQGDFFLFLIDAQHLHFHLLANLEQFAGMVDGAP